MIRLLKHFNNLSLMKSPFKNLYTGIFIFSGFLFLSCNSHNNRNESSSQDSIYQDSTFQDSIDQDTTYFDSVRHQEPENPVDELLQDDSLSVNNRDLRTP